MMGGPPTWLWSKKWGEWTGLDAPVMITRAALVLKRTESIAYLGQSFDFEYTIIVMQPAHTQNTQN